MSAAHPRRRLGVVVALSWLGAVLLTGTVAWRAVAVLDNGTPRTGLLSADQVSAAVAAARASAASPTTPTASPTPTEASSTPSPSTPTSTPDAPTSPSTAPTSTATSDPGPAPSTSAPPPAAEVARTWNVTGGVVSASCTGAQIQLLLATPSDGWTVEVGSTGPLKIEVSLHRESEETQVVATCVSGVPTEQVSTGSDDDKHGSDGHDD